MGKKAKIGKCVHCLQCSKVVECFGIGTSELSSKEKGIREKLRKRFVASTRPYKLGSSIKPFPGFGPHNNSFTEEQRAIDIPINKLYAVAEKVIRALEYRQGGQNRYIEDPYKLELFVSVREDKLPDLVSMIKRYPRSSDTRGLTLGSVSK